MDEEIERRKQKVVAEEKEAKDIAKKKQGERKKTTAADIKEKKKRAKAREVLKAKSLKSKSLGGVSSVRTCPREEQISSDAELARELSRGLRSRSGLERKR